MAGRGSLESPRSGTLMRKVIVAGSQGEENMVKRKMRDQERPGYVRAQQLLGRLGVFILKE